MYLITCMYAIFFRYTIHNVSGSQYLEYVDPENLLVVLHSVVFRVLVLMARPRKHVNMGL